MADTPLTNLDTVISTDRTAAGSQPDFSTPTGTTGAGGGGGSPTGAAGGDLGGSYPNPTVLGMTANTVTLTLGNINAGQYLLRSGTTLIGGTPSGAGNVNGPGSSVNNHVALFNGTSGTAIKDSGVTLTAGTGTPALTVNGTANVSGSNTGDQTTISGLAGSASVLYPGAKINTVTFTGASDITVYDATKLPLAGGTMSGAIAMGASKITGLANGTAASDAAAFGQIPSSLPPSGAAGGELSGTYPNPLVNLLHTNVAVHTAFMGQVSGTGLPTFRAIVASDIPTLNQDTTGNAGSVPYSGLTGTVPTWNQSTTGNAASATILQTTRTINSVNFNGSANITIVDDTKLPLTGGTMLGPVNMGAKKITNISNGSDPQDVAAFSQIPTALPPNGTASGSLGGTYPGPTVTAINETSGPTKLVIGAISDGQVLKRVSGTLVGASIGTGDVTGPSSSIAGRVATFSTTSGKVIQDSGVSITAGTGSPALTVNGTASISGTNFGIPTAAGTKYARLGRNTASALTASTDLTWYGPDVFNVKDYGATANSSTSASANDTAIGNAVTALLAYGSGTLYFPDGEWFISAPIAIAQSNNNVTVAGNGVGVTTITQTTNSKNAFTITQASRVDQTTVTGMTVRHNIGSALSSGAAIYISNSVDGANDVVPNSIIDKVYVGNAPGTASAFTYGLQLRNQKVCFVSDYAYCGNNANGGTGILFEASGASLPGQKCIATYVSNSNFALCGVGIRIKNSLETCVITNCLMAGMQYGIQTDYMIHLGVFNSHINASGSAIYSTGTGGDVDQFAFQGCLFYAQAASCITINGGFTRGTISGTTFVCPSHDSGTGAINITSGNGVNITGCSFYNYASYCVTLGSSTSQCLVSEMTYSGTAPTDYVLDNGSNNTGLTKVYTGIFSPSGSVSTYDIDIDTTLAFLGKRPVAGTVCCTNSGDVLGRFDFDASSRNNMRVSFVMRAGGNLGTGPYRYSAAVFPTT